MTVLDRRSFLTAAATAPLICNCTTFAADPKRPKLDNELGITTGSFMRHLSVERKAGKLQLLDLPKLMRDELGLRVIDLMTATLASFEPAYVEDLRNRAEKADCLITNLKMNQKGLDMASSDRAVRKRSMDEYKRTIDVAHRLGCRWVRPAPGRKRPDAKRLTGAYRELIDYAAPKSISLLIENNGWMRDDDDAIPSVVRAVGRGLKVSPDTGNWTDATRYKGLAKAFPVAVTCDFKAYMFGPNGEHPRYDLKRCFQTGWDAGFRGPWCFEHFNETLAGQLKGFVRLRDMLRRWMKEAANE